MGGSPVELVGPSHHSRSGSAQRLVA